MDTVLEAAPQVETQVAVQIDPFSHHVVAIVPAAGIGSRMGAGKPKQYLTLLGQSILAHTLDKLLSHPQTICQNWPFRPATLPLTTARLWLMPAWRRLKYTDSSRVSWPMGALKNTSARWLKSSVASL